MKKRSFRIGNHATSILLEPEFWAELERIARDRGLPLPALIAEVDQARPEGRSLASALRVYALAVKHGT